MINVPFNSIDKSIIESLLWNEVREDRTLEYKVLLPGNGREDRKEFLADITTEEESRFSPKNRRGGTDEKG